MTLAHLNICSLRNKVHEISMICYSNNVPILTLSETHMDIAYEDSELVIEGYKLFRKDCDRYGGGAALYVKDHFHVMLRKVLMNMDIELIWLQILLPHCKPFLVGCCYRPPRVNVTYLDRICDIDLVTDENKDIFSSRGPKH